MRPHHGGPCLQKAAVRRASFHSSRQGDKLKPTQNLAQTPCPGRAGVEEPKAEQRTARPPPMRSPVGCWGAQPLLPHRKSQFSSIPPFTQSLFVLPPWTALTQTDAALSRERPADLLGCRRGRGGQRLLRRPGHAEMPPSCVQNSTGWAAGAAPPGRQGRTTRL